jgi:nanoRNase/pAp phosphatase (c-di-AMP/oligoRNAs hydrolase)
MAKNLVIYHGNCADGFSAATHRVFSLRSTPEGMDVSEIAKQYGGGGHKHSAGFRIPLADIYEGVW